MCCFSCTKVITLPMLFVFDGFLLFLSILSLKLAVRCQCCSCKNETFSTLRFAQRAKAIKNKAVVNEEMEDDVNHLREVIRQLRVTYDSL